jgi:hypothetical protein
MFCTLIYLFPYLFHRIFSTGLKGSRIITEKSNKSPYRAMLKIREFRPELCMTHDNNRRISAFSGIMMGEFAH